MQSAVGKTETAETPSGPLNHAMETLKVIKTLQLPLALRNGFNQSLWS